MAGRDEGLGSMIAAYLADRASAGVSRLGQSLRPLNVFGDELAKERRLSLTDGANWSALFGRESASGKTVTLDTALQLSTVWACIRVTAQAMSVLPIDMYRRNSSGGRDRIDDHPLAPILDDSPNQDQTSLEYWETKIAWLLASGNAYSEIVRTGQRISALVPIASPKCKPIRKPDGTLVYRVIDRGRTIELPRENVFHLKTFDMGGDLGLSPIRYGVNSFGSALSAEEAAGKIFGNGLMASGVLSSESTLDKNQREQLQKIMETYTGSSKAGKLMVLEAGLKFEQLQLNPEDVQMLDTRRFQIEDLCRWFGTPPIIVGHSGQGQTMWGSGVEQIFLAWLTLGINPLAKRVEARIKKQLFAPADRRRFYAEFNREGLLQMDSKAKASFLSTVVQNGLMDRNEGRAKLNLPARDEAGQLTAQTNLAPLDSLGSSSDAQAAKVALRQWLANSEEDRHV